MKLFIAQVYIEVGVNFPFSHKFQKWISGALTEIIRPSPLYIKRYGPDFDLMFRMSAKAKLVDSEVAGPTVFKKTKDVEYTIFLPYDVIDVSDNRYACALDYLFRAISLVLQSLEIDTLALEENAPKFIETICSDPAMFKE
jgi:hypothetical protein